MNPLPTNRYEAADLLLDALPELDLRALHVTQAARLLSRRVGLQDEQARHVLRLASRDTGPGPGTAFLHQRHHLPAAHGPWPADNPAELRELDPQLVLIADRDLLNHRLVDMAELEGPVPLTPPGVYVISAASVARLVHRLWLDRDGQARERDLADDMADHWARWSAEYRRPVPRDAHDALALACFVHPALITRAVTTDALHRAVEDYAGPSIAIEVEQLLQRPEARLTRLRVIDGRPVPVDAFGTPLDAAAPDTLCLSAGGIPHRHGIPPRPAPDGGTWLIHQSVQHPTPIQDDDVLRRAAEYRDHWDGRFLPATPQPAEQLRQALDVFEQDLRRLSAPVFPHVTIGQDQGRAAFAVLADAAFAAGLPHHSLRRHAHSLQPARRRDPLPYAVLDLTTPHQIALWATCLRAHGITNPDPVSFEPEHLRTVLALLTAAGLDHEEIIDRPDATVGVLTLRLELSEQDLCALAGPLGALGARAATMGARTGVRPDAYYLGPPPTYATGEQESKELREERLTLSVSTLDAGTRMLDVLDRDTARPEVADAARRMALMLLEQAAEQHLRAHGPLVGSLAPRPDDAGEPR